MNRERAETYLRVVAEAELRRARAPARDGAAMSPGLLGGERGAVVLRRSDVAAALHITRGAVHSHTAHGLSALRAALQAGTSSPVARVAAAPSCTATPAA